jgi:hypothetical protein
MFFCEKPTPAILAIASTIKNPYFCNLVLSGPLP